MSDLNWFVSIDNHIIVTLAPVSAAVALDRMLTIQDVLRATGAAARVNLSAHTGAPDSRLVLDAEFALRDGILGPELREVGGSRTPGMAITEVALTTR